MASLLLPILPGTIPQGACPATLQDMLVLFASNMEALLENGRSFYNIGDTAPAPEFQAYPWLNTNDNRWYTYTGVWSSPNNYSGNERRLFAGSLADLVTYDGGSAGAVTPTTGPMWVEDTDAAGRSPMSPGLIPGTTAPAKTLTVGEQYGSGEYTLTDANGATGIHTHAFGVSNPGGDDAFFSRPTAPVTVQGYTGYYITGSGPNTVQAETTADLFTLPSGAAGAGVTPTPFSIVPPVIGLYIIKPSGRQYYVA